MRKLSFDRFAWIFLTIVFAVIFWAVMDRFYYREFNGDEFQHVHIAWNISQGQVIYRDFFDHHGPLYALLNGFIFKTFNLSPTLDSIFIIKYTSVLYMTLILFLTGLIGRKLFNNNLAGYFSAILLFGFYFFHAKATEIRPDVIQTVFWLAGVYSGLLYKEKTNLYWLFASGLLFGLMLMTNLKSMAGLSAFGFYLLVSNIYFKKINLIKVIKEYLVLFLGVIIIFLLFSCYFLLNNSFPQFIFYNFTFNFMASAVQSNPLPVYIKVFFKLQQEFYLILFMVSVCLAVKELKKHKNENLLFVLIIISVTSIGLFMRFYAQYYFIFEPFVAILGVYGFKKGIEMMQEKYKFSENLPKYLLVLLFLPALTITIGYPHKPDEFYLQQVKNINFILQNTKRKEAVMHTWSEFPCYVFNADSMYYWHTSENYDQVYSKIAGFNVTGKYLIDILKNKNIKYINTNDRYMGEALAPETQKYILANYYPSTEYLQLWIRKW